MLGRENLPLIEGGPSNQLDGFRERRERDLDLDCRFPIMLMTSDRSCYYFLIMSEAGRATRNRILDAGLDLLSTSGFAGVTVGVLANQAGMSKSGLFAHFRSKEEIDIALLERTLELASKNIVVPAMRAQQGVPRLTVFVESWFGWPTRVGLLGGCPAAAGMFELDDVEGPVREKLLELEKHWNEVLRQFVVESIAIGDFREDLDIDQFIWELMGFYLNHHVSRRFMRSRDANMRAKQAFNGLIDRSRSVKSKKPGLKSSR